MCVICTQNESKPCEVYTRDAYSFGRGMLGDLVVAVGSALDMAGHASLIAVGAAGAWPASVVVALAEGTGVGGANFMDFMGYMQHVYSVEQIKACGVPEVYRTFTQRFAVSAGVYPAGGVTSAMLGKADEVSAVLC